MHHAEWRAEVAIGMMCRTYPFGVHRGHSSTVMPPIEPPTTTATDDTPRWSSTSLCNLAGPGRHKAFLGASPTSSSPNVISDCSCWKLRPIWIPCDWVRCDGRHGAIGRAHHIDAHNEETIRVKRLPSTHQRAPP